MAVIREVKMKLSNKALKTLLKKKGVNGYGKGLPRKDGKLVSKKPGLIVTVDRKLPEFLVKPGDLVPKDIDGHKTDVIEIGDIKALPALPQNTEEAQRTHGIKVY